MAISDATVQAKTGQTWEAWFRVLDDAGGRQMDHKGIISYLETNHGFSGWWEQMVAARRQNAGALAIRRSPSVRLPRQDSPHHVERREDGPARVLLRQGH